MNTKQKGNNFERDCSRMLSLWWTNGKRDDAIWRSASSGALTTVGKGRYLAHTGDFAATDGDAELLFKHVIIEAKRGYNRYSMQDLLDVPYRVMDKNPVWQMQYKLGKACQEQQKDGLLLWKRDRRELLVFYRPLPGRMSWPGAIDSRWLTVQAPDASYYHGMRWSNFEAIVSADRLKSWLGWLDASSLSTQLTSS